MSNPGKAQEIDDSNKLNMCNSCGQNQPKQIEEGDKVEYRLVITVREFVNGEQNMVCYDHLCGIYPTLVQACEAARVR